MPWPLIAAPSPLRADCRLRTFRISPSAYTRNYREGEKSSTSWGAAHPALGVNRALSPSFYDIHEHSDSFQLDVTHEIKTTHFGAGLRYEFGTPE